MLKENSTHSPKFKGFTMWETWLCLVKFIVICSSNFYIVIVVCKPQFQADGGSIEKDKGSTKSNRSSCVNEKGEADEVVQSSFSPLHIWSVCWVGIVYFGKLPILHRFQTLLGDPKCSWLKTYWGLKDLPHKCFISIKMKLFT